MRPIVISLTMLLAASLLGGCSKKQEMSGGADEAIPPVALLTEAPMCSDLSSTKTVASLFIDRIVSAGGEQRAAASKLTDGAHPFMELVQEREHLAISKVSTALITSSGYDESIHKRSCNGQISVAGIDQKISVEYTIQLQEDRKGSVVSAHFNIPDGIAGMNSVLAFQNLFLGSMFSKEIADREAAEAAEATAQADHEKAEMELQLAEQKTAKKEKALADLALANQVVTETWNALPDLSKDQLLAQQKAWTKKKEVDCKLEAAGKSTDIVEKETARLECETRASGLRAEELKQKLNG